MAHRRRRSKAADEETLRVSDTEPKNTRDSGKFRRRRKNAANKYEIKDSETDSSSSNSEKDVDESDEEDYETILSGVKLIEWARSKGLAHGDASASSTDASDSDNEGESDPEYSLYFDIADLPVRYPRERVLWYFKYGHFAQRHRLFITVISVLGLLLLLSAMLSSIEVVALYVLLFTFGIAITAFLLGEYLGNFTAQYFLTNRRAVVLIDNGLASSPRAGSAAYGFSVAYEDMDVLATGKSRKLSRSRCNKFCAFKLQTDISLPTAPPLADATGGSPNVRARTPPLGFARLRDPTEPCEILEKMISRKRRTDATSNHRTVTSPLTQLVPVPASLKRTSAVYGVLCRVVLAVAVPLLVAEFFLGNWMVGLLSLVFVGHGAILNHNAEAELAVGREMRPLAGVCHAIECVAALVVLLLELLALGGSDVFPFMSYLFVKIWTARVVLCVVQMAGVVGLLVVIARLYGLQRKYMEMMRMDRLGPSFADAVANRSAQIAEGQEMHTYA